jgi:serine/threonine protein phosphatase 1
MSKFLIVSDLHGAHKTLMALLDKHGAGRQLISCGDEIDRGKRSREVVEYMMANKVPSVASNHIDLCLAYSAHAKLGYRAKCSRYYDRNVWLHNGGDETLESWGLHRGQPLPREVLDWMVSLPPYLIIDTPNAAGRKLMVSHAGYGFDADKDNWMRALWGRYPDDGEFMYEEETGEPMDDGLYRVFGHTRVKEAVVTSCWANIDSGCSYTGYGTMSALLWPEMTVVTHDNIDV